MPHTAGEEVRDAALKRCMTTTDSAGSNHAGFTGQPNYTLADEDSPMFRSLAMVVEMRGDHGQTSTRKGWAYGCLESLVVGAGFHTVCVPGVSGGVTPMDARECYRNAWEVALANPNMIYTEGYAFAFSHAIDHAWLTDRTTGEVVDPTWATVRAAYSQKTRDAEGPGGVEYLGVRFSKRFLGERIRKHRTFGLLTSLHLAKNDMLRRGFVTEPLNADRPDYGRLVTGLRP